MSRVLSFEEVQRYIALVRAGEGLTAAARRLNLNPKDIREARKVNPEFNEEVVIAETEAAEPIERELYTAAMNGQPWAIKLWLERRSSDRWGAIPITVKHEHGLAPGVEHILELAQRLEMRRDMLGITEGSIIDVEPED